MAPTKRKRNSTGTKPHKRPKRVQSSDSNTWWESECILEEKHTELGAEYLVKWKGIDPDTGKVWIPSWEPEEHVNEALRESWKQDKAQRAIVSTSGRAETSRGKRRPQEQQEAQQPRRRTRHSRVIESSPEPSTAHSSTLPSQPSTPARDSAAPTVHSSTVTTPIVGPSVNHPSPRVQIPARGSSFEPEEYHRYSQLAASQRASTQSRTQETDLNSSQLFAAARPYSTGIVPDSQSSAGEASYIPVTQRTHDSNQPSTNTNGSQEEEGVIEDSGLLDIIQEAASRDISPAPSIPETIPDTVPDSQNQHQGADIIDLREIPNTLETVESSSQAVHIHHRGDQQLVTQPERRQEQNTLSASVEGVSQPPQDSASQAIVQVGGQQGECEPHAQTTALEIAEIPSQPLADTAEEGTQFVPQHISTALHNSFTQKDQQEKDQEAPTSDQVLVVGNGETSQRQSSQHGTRDSQASLAEQSVPEDNAQFPFHSQQPFHHYHPAQQTPNQAIEQDHSINSAREIPRTELVDNLAPSAPPEEGPVIASIGNTSTTTSESPDKATHRPAQAVPELPSHTLEQQDDLANESLEPNYTQYQSPTVAQKQQLEEAIHTAVQAADISQSVTGDSVLRRDFALTPQSPRSTGQSTESREQNAQVLPDEVYLSTQEDIAESIRSTIEKERDHERASSSSRHDSSQETPERQFISVEISSSAIPHPPSFSLGTFDSKLPPRPTTPVPSSPSSMANHDTGAKLAQQLSAARAKKQAENPYQPTSRVSRLSFTPSATTPEGSARRLLRTNASPSAEGTRSPSTVPDRSPAPQAPTSLRTVAFAPSNSVPRARSQEADMSSIAGARPEPVEVEMTAAAEEPVVPLDVPVMTELVDEELSDADDEDSESLLNDELQLDREEYIVPLFIEGRQSDMYSAHMKLKKDVLGQFVNDPRGFTPLSQVEEVLSYFRAVETHIDLVFAEAESGSWNEESSATEAEFAAQFGMENSTKFRFLHSLFHHLRDHEKHVVLVTERDNDALFHILEKFCRANFVNYAMPTKGRQADPSHTEGTLTVTIFPSDASPIIRAPDVIICLDGVQEASKVRQKNWARSSDRGIVPILHLVIPRTVGHIERYISPALDDRERMHTTLASLAQMREELGKPIDEDTPRAPVVAAMIVDWLVSADDDGGLTWPLPSIGSVKDVIEFQTQMSQTSTASPRPERTKRPLDNEDLDPVKRMRFTPQPQAAPSSSVNNEHEVTHISDSMPGTAAEATSLRRQLARVEEAYSKERAARKEEEKRFREHEEMWDKQQTVHENLTRDYRLLLGQQKTTGEKLETMTKNNETLRERLTTRTTELRQLTDQLEEQRATYLLSEDEKIVEITRLRKELSTMQEEKQRATKNAQTAEATLEYTKEQYRLAQEAASSSQSRVSDLEVSNAKLSHQASGQAEKLKSIHIDRQYEYQNKQLKSLKAENSILKKTLSQKEDELVRARNIGRVGVGTRAHSVTPQPKVRSRAGSPMGGRLNHLRNG